MEQVSSQETAEILHLAEQALKAEGDFVELGCYKGDTSLLLAKLLKTQMTEKRLWLYDSFVGLPPKTKEDTSVAGDQFKAGELFVSKHEVINKFKRANLKVPIIKKAFFEDLNPETDLPSTISFAFCDGDLYNSIKTSLCLVLPKLAREGIIIVHDYNNPELPGSSRAVDEFMYAHPDFKLTQKYTLAILTRKS